MTEAETKYTNNHLESNYRPLSKHPPSRLKKLNRCSSITRILRIRLYEIVYAGIMLEVGSKPKAGVAGMG